MEAVMPIITGIAEERLIFLVIALAIVGVLLIILIILQNMSKNTKRQKESEKIVLKTIFPDENLATAIATSLGVSVEEAITQSDLKDIKKLVVEYSELKDLTGISNLVNLEEMSLSNNKIEKLPEELGKLENLQSIQLAYNDISNIEVLAQNQKLQKLDISGNDVSEQLDLLFSLPALEDLIVINANAKELSPEIEKAKTLKNLNMSYNSLTKIPEEIGKLALLETLNVGNNKLKSLPTTLATNTAITEIGLTGNALEAIPNEVQEMMRKKNIPVPVITPKEEPKAKETVDEKQVTLAQSKELEKEVTPKEKAIETPKLPSPEKIAADMALADKIKHPEHAEIISDDKTEGKVVEKENEGEKEMSNKKMNTFIDLTSSHDNLLAELEALENKKEQPKEAVVETPAENKTINDKKTEEKVTPVVEKIAEVAKSDVKPEVVVEEVKEKVVELEPVEEIKEAVIEPITETIIEKPEVSFTEVTVTSDNTREKRNKIIKTVAITAGVAVAAVAIVGGAYALKQKNDSKKKKGIFRR